MIKPGSKVKFKDEKIHPGIPTQRKGKLLAEYKHFYLIQTNSGYRECINKAMLIDKTARIEVYQNG